MSSTLQKAGHLNHLRHRMRPKWNLLNSMSSARSHLYCPDVAFAAKRNSSGDDADLIPAVLVPVPIGALRDLLDAAERRAGGRPRPRPGPRLVPGLLLVLRVHLEGHAEALCDLLRAPGLAPAPVDEHACDDAGDLVKVMA